jgi:hypothetical protein
MPIFKINLVWTSNRPMVICLTETTMPFGSIAFTQILFLLFKHFLHRFSGLVSNKLHSDFFGNIGGSNIGASSVIFGGSEFLPFFTFGNLAWNSFSNDLVCGNNLEMSFSFFGKKFFRVNFAVASPKKIFLKFLQK